MLPRVANFPAYSSAFSRRLLAAQSAAAACSVLGAPPTGTINPYGGFRAPDGWLFCHGQAISRTDYAALFAALTEVQSGTLTSESATVTGLSDTSILSVGMKVEGTGVPAGTTIAAIVSATSITLSANATASGAQSLRFFAHGNGDGSTTFNVVDMHGYVPAGRDNMGGTAANRLQGSTTISTMNASASATVASATGLAIGMVITSANVPAGTTITAISGTTITMSAIATATASGAAARFSILGDAQSLGQAGGSQPHTQVTDEMPAHTHSQYAAVFDHTNAGGLQGQGAPPSNRNATTSSTGGGLPHNNTQPTIILNCIIKT